MSIGQKIKDLRILHGLTQEELADRAELSKGFISQVERDLTSPSIATLEDILQCLGVEIGDFFSGDTSRQIVFGEEDYFVKEDADTKTKIEWIVPNAQKNSMEPIKLTLEAGGETLVDSPHEGEEFGYVLKGSVKIHIEGKCFVAKEGETFYYVADRRHKLSSDKGAEIIWISTPPNF
ncbi:helix-turn-helix domain-containing protein [Eubacteriales bacterium KG127]